MLALRVIEHLDVIEHILSGLNAGLVGPPPYPLALEQEDENAKLKRLLADTMLDNAGLKDLLSKKW